MTTLGSTPSSSYSWRILRHPFLTDRTLRKYGIRRYLICDLNLPTGRVLACDPVTSVGYVKPLAQTVPPGRYPVFGYEALVKAPDHYKTALIELWLNDAPNENWRLALREGQAAETVIDDASYGVDAAAACFCDATAQPFLVYAEENYDPDGDDDVNLLEVAFGCGRGEEHRFPNSELNMAVFTTGDGDGTYPCFWNYDDAGCPSRLVTSFGILEQRYDWGEDYPEPFLRYD
ncbi:DUF4241 domain-containing protein [Aurantimonas sp. C2-6-R+9]|uniref:DUF4241 domain-containing protein n=1 Tax=unclassified Aurantimonas TaxID=2638230 RepID=UPI002E19E278|nr:MULTISPECIES: DUF4241 domain-containing protein [unclassified Aurantimonas]MEC5293104.1 DUF4241 domain-containing protein [Aurantimonas sp. C2-3-R2]MEC5383210.1 DUF4241 domain-containing protein [Aurantimonas sp. C2-6-R+9]MEC5414172.1 DUF4241 domain-containing protein [Aurantimonas sp. C2-4-R8]